MKKLLALFVLFSTGIIITFLIFSSVEEAISNKLGESQAIATYSGLSFMFLVADIVFPIPSSLVMILNGKIVGVVGGTLLSWTSSLISSAIGFYLGRTTAKGFNRFFSEKEIHQGNLFFDKYGDLSIAVSKGIPILSEVVSFISGNTAIPFKRFFLYSMAGHMAVSLIYAWIGSYLVHLDSYWASGAVILGTVGLFFILRVFTGTKHDMQRG